MFANIYIYIYIYIHLHMSLYETFIVISVGMLRWGYVEQP